MAPQGQAPKIREVVVANDPANADALVGRVDAFQFRIGGPDGVGHISSGPNPYDLLSAALAACTAMTVRFEARRKQLPLKRVEVGVDARGHRLCRKAVVCGVLFRVPDRNKAHYVRQGFDVGCRHGSTEWMLPIPATFVTDRRGRLRRT